MDNETLDTLSSKKKKLSEINSEVKDFHPLLNKLLIKFPRVIKVDYTHGPSEKGADFVLTRTDDLFSDVEYIGVIAKIGKISKDLVNIENQIDDCDLIRFTLNGKKNIKLDEIWIINNDSISINAQEKIFNKFSGKKIKFIDSKILINFIDNYLVSYWSEVPLNFGQYLYDLKSEVNEIEKSHTLLPANVEPFYVKQQLRQIENQYKIENAKQSKKTKYELDELIEKNEVIVIEGGPGSGKSHMIRNVIKYYCEPSTFIKLKLFPVSITYHEYVKVHSSSLLKVVDNKLNKCKNEIDTNSKYIIFIDGFDESIDRDRSIENEIEHLVKDAYDNKIKVVLTTRPLNIIDYKNLLPCKTPGYEIVPLGTDKVYEFFKHICKNIQISEKIVNDLKKSELFKQLPKSPISAILLAHLMNQNSKDLPSNLTEIYSQYSELMLGRWEINKGLKSQKEYEASKSILSFIAKFLIENDIQKISIEESKKMFDDYLRVRNLDIDAEELFYKITSRSGILQRDDNFNLVYFKHRSFLEFFYALYKTNHPDSDFINNRVYSMFWRNIYFFYIGIHKDCEEILNSILKIAPEKEDERFLRILNMADYFLAGYSTPYIVLEKNLPKLLIEYSNLYCEVIENRIDTPLKELSEIMILEFFSQIIKNCYSYEFFHKALEGSIVEICSDKSNNEFILIHTLFFVSVIFRAMNIDNPFDGLLDRFKGRIPLTLRFGLYYENSNKHYASTLIKRNEKKLKVDLKKSKELRQLADNLHKLPVSKIIRINESTE